MQENAVKRKELKLHLQRKNLINEDLKNKMETYEKELKSKNEEL